LIDSHFFTAFADECNFVISHWANVWLLESLAAFYVVPADALGNCRAGTLPVYRFFDNRNDANHRYTINLGAPRDAQSRVGVEGSVRTPWRSARRSDASPGGR
jgi:hypothetical protein